MLKFPCHLPKLFFKMNGIAYGKDLTLLGWPFIFRFPHASIKIGDQVRMNSNFWSNLLGLNHRTILIAKGRGALTVGDRVGMSGVAIYAWEKISIGEKTQIGANTKIMDTDFHPVDPDARLIGKHSATKTAPVIIGKNVFIGANVLILKGSQIGDNCVVGAGSVVRGSFGSNCVIAGNPARVVRLLQSQASADSH